MGNKVKRPPDATRTRGRRAVKLVWRGQRKCWDNAKDQSVPADASRAAHALQSRLLACDRPLFTLAFKHVHTEQLDCCAFVRSSMKSTEAPLSPHPVDRSWLTCFEASRRASRMI